MRQSIFSMVVNEIRLSAGGRIPVICEKCKSFLYEDNRMAVDRRWVRCPHCGHHFQTIFDAEEKEREHA